MFYQKANAFNTLTIPQSTRVVKQKKKCSSKLENELKLLEQWSKNTNVVFNCKKTKSMLFSTRKMSQHHQLYNNDKLKISCNNQTIERVQQYKLVGVAIDEHFEL